MQKEQKANYEINLFDKAVKYVKNVMTEEKKEMIYRIGIGEFNWNIKKETLPEARYTDLRDKWIASSLAGLGALDKVEDFTDEYVKKEFVNVFSRMSTSNHFVKNALKALNTTFKDQSMEILNITGEDSLDLQKLEYLGSKTYAYAGMFIISFENSPAAVEIRYMMNY